MLFLLTLWACSPKPADDASTETAESQPDTDVTDTAPTGVTDTDTGAPTETGTTLSDTGDTDASDTAGDTSLEDTDTGSAPTDLDGDGYTEADGDCDDTDPGSYPGATEICDDGIDQDCSGRADNTCTVAHDIESVGYLEVTGKISFDRVGQSLAIGDFDGNGEADMAVAADGYEGFNQIDRGAVWLAINPDGGTSTANDFPGILNAGYGTVLPETSDSFGRQVQAVADLDGDGSDELLVSASGAEGPGGTRDAGVWYLFYGPLGELGALSTSSDAAAVITNDGSDERMGEVLPDYEHDFSGDGTADLLLSVHNRPSSGEGKVLVFNGPVLGTTSTDDADLTITGTVLWSYAGTATAAGDVGGDGLADVAVGADAINSADGVVWLLESPTTGDWTTADAVATWPGSDARRLGSRLAMGDMNGDGYDDLVIGEPYYSSSELHEGRLQVYLGDAGGIDTTAALSVEGAAASAELGRRDFGLMIQDLDGDGFGDLTFGSGTRPDYRGAMSIVHGPASGALTMATVDITVGGRDYESMGSSVDAADVNGDGEVTLGFGAVDGAWYLGSAWMIPYGSL